ncbi:unnamed protein product [Cercopithifilaria johnstoni]|uniref:Uncharacterized protein n=1 Tax=Cercopithifilaria johnstoni TaxID=2874296 RepID=A0A8J2M890_9BILA|nr:unnamed protein product [Cercopithifilaria johnstoni]
MLIIPFSLLIFYLIHFIVRKIFHESWNEWYNGNGECNVVEVKLVVMEAGTHGCIVCATIPLVEVNLHVEMQHGWSLQGVISRENF